MARVERHFSGTIAGKFAAVPTWPPYVLDIGARRNPVPFEWNPEGSASLSGDGADDGTLGGTFDGYAVVGYYPEIHECIGPYSWTLTPR
jgi:hypothetical protein